LVGNVLGKKSPGRSGSRWEDNIVIDLKEIGWVDLDWIYLAQNRVDSGLW
jgi:hypothetical protein